LESGNAKDAVAPLRKAVSLVPRSSYMRLELAQAILEGGNGNPEEALQMLRVALVDEDQSYLGYRLQSEAYGKLNRIPEANMSAALASFHQGCVRNAKMLAERAKLGLAAEMLALLAIGTWPSTKGFDRIVLMLPHFKEAKLLVCGAASHKREAVALLAQARGLGVADRVFVLGPREDVPHVMAAVDLLVHPARAEASGIVIVEAIVNGLPIIATEICGFSSHIRRADAGIVIPEPFTTSALIDALGRAAEPLARAAWSANGASYGTDPELYSGIDRALEAIVKID